MVRTQLSNEFAQVTHGEQRATLGLGLGLPIAGTLALANGGNVTYQRDGGETQSILRLLAPTAPSDPDRADRDQDTSLV